MKHNGSTSEGTTSSGDLITVRVFFLCLVSGCVDAVSLLALGDVFASVMTGNIVLIGIAIGTIQPTLAVFCLFGILGYCAGVGTGSFSAKAWRRPNECSVWPARVTYILSIEALILLTGGVWWFVVGVAPELKLILLFMLAFAMGMQGAAVRSLGVAVSTTYLTGALTTLVEAIVTRRRFSTQEIAAISGLTALMIGALTGALLLTLYSPVALALPVVAITLVIIISLAKARLVGGRMEDKKRSSQERNSLTSQ